MNYRKSFNRTNTAAIKRLQEAREASRKRIRRYKRRSSWIQSIVAVMIYTTTYIMLSTFRPDVAAVPIAIMSMACGSLGFIITRMIIFHPERLSQSESQEEKDASAVLKELMDKMMVEEIIPAAKLHLETEGYTNVKISYSPEPDDDVLEWDGTFPESILLKDTDLTMEHNGRKGYVRELLFTQEEISVTLDFRK